MKDKKDTKLQIRIDNKQPVELMDLTKALLSLSSQFNNYTSKHGNSKEARLYFKEIKSGSIILELIEIVAIGVIPFIENTNTVLEFAEYLKKVFDYLLKGGEKPDLTESDYKDFYNIVNPITTTGNSMTIGTVVGNNNKVNIKVYIDSTESNAAQNITKKEIKSLKEPESKDGILEKVVMVLFQARGDIKNQKGNKGIIEEESQKPLNLIFDNNAIKGSILHSDTNPFNTAFVVDAKIQTLKEKPIAYKILRLHESFDIED